MAMFYAPTGADRPFSDAAILAILATLARHADQKEAKAKRGLADWQLRRVTEKLESMQDIHECAEALPTTTRLPVIGVALGVKYGSSQTLVFGR